MFNVLLNTAKYNVKETFIKTHMEIMYSKLFYMLWGWCIGDVCFSVSFKGLKMCTLKVVFNFWNKEKVVGTNL